MKKLLFVIGVIGFLTIPLLTDENAVIEKAAEFFRADEFAKALEVVEEGIKTDGATNNLMRVKYLILVRMEKLDEALSFLDKWIKSSGETPQLLMQKLFLQKKQGKYKEALQTALRKEEIVKKKNPYDCMDVVEIYTRLNNLDKAFEWLDKAVDRGFNSITALQTASLKPLTEDPRFEKIRVKIKDKLGLEKPAKDFTVKLYDGGDFQLSKQKGKVILIDFWATWCGPCIREIPNLKQYYRAYKDKGFEIIGISLDKPGDTLKQYMEKEKLPWKIAYSGKFWNDETARQYGINAIPSYWLVDKKGILRYHNLRGEQLKKAIEELTAEK